MTFQQAAEIWQGYVGSQSPVEFVEQSMRQGHASIRSAVTAYVAELPNMFPSDDIPADRLPEIADGLTYYLAEHGF